MRVVLVGSAAARARVRPQLDAAAVEIVDEAATLLEHGSLKRGYLGIAGQPATLGDAQRPAAGRDDGVLVVNVASGSPAAAGGVLVGDVILDFDGEAIGSPDDLVDRLAGRAGQPVRLRMLRGGAAIELTVVVSERDGR